MDDATQHSTQPYADPRRSGVHNSGLDQQDVADIICILHPSSIHAHRAVAATARRAPQHILKQHHDLEYEPDPNFPIEQNHDIALRFSSYVKDLGAGFYFGRNSSRCDILITADENEKKISNMHFRIYIKTDGIIMLEDTSTNGTVVDDILIRKDRKDNTPTTQMLMSGSIIQVLGSEVNSEIKFIVRIPPRDEYQGLYHRNFVQYLNKIRNVTKNVGGENGREVSEFIIPQQNFNSHGMRWNGGSKYNVTGQIGKGAFATVYKLATKNDGTLFACKELDKRRLMKNTMLDYKVDSEMRIMRDLEHPNIVQFHDYHDHENRWIYIIMEYVGGGELSSLMSQMGKLPESMVQTIARQILHALHYLHSKRITHRDIKPDNILISSLDPVRVKLSDFGLSKVVQEETFLKTFCGTLLYCAPEVYPEYEDYKKKEARKRRRVGDPLPKTSPYNQSVDMWSFGAVLFHILCGAPPYMGRADDRGAQMLQNIMTTDANYNKLRRVGVSEAGIDFISSLLNRDPQSRPKESRCFKHPWLVNIPDEFDYMEIDDVEEEQVNTDLKAIAEASEPDSSEYEQLSASGIDLHDITDDPFAEESDFNDPSISDFTNIKRPRVKEEQDGDLIAIPLPENIPYPSLPDISSYNFGSSAVLGSTPTAKRLFGEIPRSALQSSGVLGDLQVRMDGPQFQRDFESVHESQSSNSKSEPLEDRLHNAAPSKYLLSEIPPKFGRSTSSLQSAESLAGNVNMGSFGGVSTSPNSDKEEKNEVSYYSGDDVGDKSFADVEDNLDYGEKHARPSPVRRVLTPGQRSSSSASLRARLSRNLSLQNDHPGDESYEASWEELACTIDERTGQSVRQSAESDSHHKPHSSATVDRYSQSTTKPGTDSQVTATSSKPPTILGKLTPIPGSITDQVIHLRSRMTSWGRGSGNTIRYPDRMDVRIPAYALELTFWAPAIEARIDSGEDWLTVPDVVTLVSTKTSKRIWVNDIELQSETPDRMSYLFGRVYTGDIITVYGNHEEFLKYKCEFFYGDSTQSRPKEEDGFIIQTTKKARSDTASKGAASVTASTATGKNIENGVFSDHNA
ncbi:Protein kinase protein rad53 [Ophidiomyces ophidiicola]|nr:Protein kinase protein rad53 [Ophidiomyces ophidiicola]